jgi:hypothetical protein
VRHDIDVVNFVNEAESDAWRSASAAAPATFTVKASIDT